ncbi:PBECR2 nuclease fold domain-containing protein [Desulfobacter hydrogenophilus]|nr:PBECR2 nuclease fold domain-containing protein [Desulfobacter hydrogenophilus]NDY73976.1 phage head morphogenesis protein [Desulfobacter hydrogenophilus]
MGKVKPQALPFKDAHDFWKEKLQLSPKEYYALSDEAKMKAFAVSGMARGDELAMVYEALTRAIEGKIGFEDFKKGLSDVWEKRGWTGVSAWRVDNIFRTNVQAAYMAGRWKQAIRAAGTRPYGQYSAVLDVRTRPTHTAVHGMVYPLDHAFWDTWWPLNGFRCRCTVKTLSERQVKNQGLTVQTEDMTGKLVEPVDPKTGNKVPARLLMPDPGFTYHPGKSAFGGITPAEGPGGLTDIGIRTFENYKRRKMDNLPVAAHHRFTDKDLLENKADYMQRTGHDSKAAEAHFVKAFLTEFGLKAGEVMVYKDVLGEAVVIGEDLFKTAGGKLKITKKGREKYLKLLARTIKEPYEVWLVPQKNIQTGRVILRRRYIAAFSDGPDNKITGFATFDYDRHGWEGVTAFPPDKMAYTDALRNGALIYKK